MRKIIIFLSVWLPLALSAQISTFPYLENFEGTPNATTNLPNGWSESGLSSDGIWSTGNSTSASSAYLTFPSHTNFAYTNDDVCNCDKSADLLITPVFDLSALSAAQVSFDYFNDNGGFSPELTSIAYSIDSGLTFIPFDTLPMVTAWTTKTYDISTLTGAGFDKVVFAIRFDDKGSWAYGLGVDNVAITTPPSCTDPIANNATAITGNSATLSWVETGTATQWQVEYGTAGHTLGTGIKTIVNTDTFKLITGLSASSTYDWYVRAICGPGASDTSAWTTKKSFTTPCGAIMAPFTESFNTTTIPNCWTQSATSGGPWTFGGPGFSWNTSGCPGSSPLDHTGNSGKYAAMDFSVPDAGVILTMPPVDVSALTAPYLQFYFTMCGVGYTPLNQLNVEAFDGTNWNLVSMIQQGTTGWEEFTFTLTSYIFNTNQVQIRFRAEPGGGSVFYGDMAIDDVSIIETPTCISPSALSTSNSTGSSTTLSWVERGSAVKWEVEYGPQNFTLGSGNSSIVNVDTFKMISGLTPVTSYSWYVRAICGSNDTSAWTGPSSFTTPCATYTPPYSQDFTTYIPNCWQEAKGQLKPSTVFTSTTSSLWNADGWLNNGTTGSASINIWSTGKFEWLISPSIDLGALGHTYRLEYDAGMTAYSGTGPSTMGPDDTLSVVISTDNGATWSSTKVLKLYDVNNPPLNTGATEYIDLSSYSGVIKIGFYATTTVSNADYNVYIDNFKVRTTPLCPEPSANTATGITSTDATLSWIENGIATDYKVEYGPSGYTPGSGTSFIVLADTFKVVTGLTPATNYDWYVAAICGRNDTSSWSIASSFTTACATFSIPFYEDFTTYLPNCWEEAQGFLTSNTVFTSTSTSNWNADGWLNNGSTGAVGLNIYGSSRKEWFISPTIDLGSAAHNYQLEFDAGLTDWGNSGPDVMGIDDTLAVVISTDNGVTWSKANTLRIFDVNNPPSNSGQTVIVNLSAYTGLIKIGFYGVSTISNQDYDVFIDNFKVRTPPSCPVPTTNAVNGLTSTSAGISWVENGSAAEWEVEWDTAGFTLGTGRNVVQVLVDTFTTLTGLTAKSHYDWYVRAVCGVADSSVWTSLNRIYTGYCIPAPTSVDGQGITNVTLNNLNNTTGAETGNYGDYTNMSANVQQGVAENLNITFSTGYTYDTQVWVDWNNDLDFDDAGETVFVGTSTSNNPTVLNATFTVPVSTALGQYTMRIGGGDNPVTACYTGSYASFEDYTLMVLAAPSCLVPDSTTTLNITNNSALARWIENGTATEWEVEWDTSGFTLGTGRNVVKVLVDTFTTFSGLNANTKYDWYVRSVCGIADSSLWTSMNSFTTLPNAVTVPYTQDFEGSNPLIDFQTTVGGDAGLGIDANTTCSGTNTLHMTGGTSSGWSGSSSAGGTTPTQAWVTNSTKISDATLNVDATSVTAGLGLTFDLKQTWSFGPGYSWSRILVNGVQVSPDYHPATQGSDPCSNLSIDLSAYAGTNFTLTFQSAMKYDAANNASGGDNAYFDNIMLQTVSCPEPTSLTTFNTTATSTDVAWVEAGSATSWQVEWDTLGYTKGTARNNMVVSNDTFNISSLSPATAYAWSVRAICGSNDTSLYTSPTAFNTPCASYTPPYMEDFSTYLPNCWEEATGQLLSSGTVFTNTSSSQWVADGFLNNGTTGSARMNIWSTNKFEWLISPSIDLGSGGTNYQLEFDAGLTDYSGSGNDIMGSDDTLSVVISTDNGATWLGTNTLMLYDVNNPLDSAGTHVTIDLSSYSGLVKVGFYATSTVSNQDYNVYIDNVEFKEKALPYYPIGTINTVDATTGVADSLTVVCWTSGTVAGVDLDGNNGISFTIVDKGVTPHTGINVFNFNDVSNYVVNEGDSIMLRGNIQQYNGLTEFVPDSIRIISTGHTLPPHQVVTFIDESMESTLIEIRGLVVTQVTPTGSSGTNVNMTNGTNTIAMRIDNDTDVDDSITFVVGDTICSVKGIGGQFDNSNPYTSGYQIFPMRFSDIDTLSCRIGIGINDSNSSTALVEISPNPTHGTFIIKTDGFTNSQVNLTIRDVSGRLVMNETINNAKTNFIKNIDISEQAKGVYFVRLQDGKQIITKKLIIH